MMRKNPFLVIIICCMTLLQSCEKESEVNCPYTHETTNWKELYPTTIKGYFNGKEVLIKDNNAVGFGITGYLLTYPDNVYVNREICSFSIKMSDNTVIDLELDHPYLNKQEYFFKRGSYKSGLRESYARIIKDVSILDELQYYTPSEDGVVVKVDEAIRYNKDVTFGGYYLDLLINGNFTSVNNSSTIEVKDLHVKVYIGI